MVKSAMPKRPIKAEDLFKMVFVGEPQISPDGNRILFTRKHIGEKNKYVTNLYSVDMEGCITQWTQGENGAGNGRWSPDGHTIAFVSGRDKPASQIYLIPTSGGEATKLTDLPEGSLGGFKWSPDGTKIAFTFRETEPSRTEKAKKEREEKGLSSPPWEIDSIQYRLDGDGYFANQRHELYVFDVAEKKVLCRYKGSVDGGYSFDWNPNSKELVVIHSASKKPFADPPNDQLYRLALDGKATHISGLPKGNKGEPRWSPDGKWIAYAGDVDEKDPWGTRNTKLYVVKPDGGAPRDLTGHEDYDMAVGVMSDVKDSGFSAVMEWAPDSKGIYIQIGWHGEGQLGYIDLKEGGTKFLTEGNHSIMVGNVSHDARRVAATWGHATKLQEVAVIEAELATGHLVPRVLTGFNQAFHDEVKLSKPEEVWLDSTDGVKVQCWVIKPIGYKEPKQYPAVLEIHGGPHAMYGCAMFHEFQLLAAEGYVVVYSNPRGSKGYGEAFCGAIRGDWGNKDWDDIQAVTRWMQHQPYINSGQMGVMGGSYGGYMTNWVIGHTHEFKAAITDRCVSNMVSMAGNSDFPFNKDGYFKGVAWGDHSKIKELWKQSPIAFFETVKTPTLIIHSEGDLRCNIEQSEQVFTALQQQGIDSRFVRYPQNSSHGLSRNGPPDLRLHRLGEITKWWATHLKIAK
jgi:dipeptidyl aminopeptidase/acylaminoacyl peptidase